jgi:hypothetical protein
MGAYAHTLFIIIIYLLICMNECMYITIYMSLHLYIHMDSGLYIYIYIGANHVFLNLVAPDTVVNTDFFDNELKRICTKYWYKMNGLAVTTVEMKLSCRLTVGSEPLLVRFIASNPTGFVLKVDTYISIYAFEYVYIYVYIFTYINMYLYSCIYIHKGSSVF